MINELPKWGAHLGYRISADEFKVIAYIEYWAHNFDAAVSYANRHADALFDSHWGPYTKVVGPLE